MTGFAVGEEAEQQGDTLIREVGKVAAPDRSLAAEARTRLDGPRGRGGADAQDRPLLPRRHSGFLRCLAGTASEGRRPAARSSGAAPWRTAARARWNLARISIGRIQLDGEGNMINKRNAWQARSVLYVRLIPPGAADTVAHYRVKIPKDAKGPLQFTAKLNYRKFSWYYTQFAYAGQPKPNQDPKLLSASFNSMEYSFDPHNIPQNVSGNIKDRIPDLPIVVVASAKASVPLGPSAWTPVVRKEDRERWNDWGIGLLLQGDLKGAEYAFKKVTEAEPGYADGWLNVARALIQEGETEAAKPYVEHAMRIDSKLGRVYFFKAMIEKADGKYDDALRSLDTTLGMYPRDRVALNQAARILFLERKYAEALKYLDRVCDVDPEDLQMHYTRMLCLRGVGDAAGAGREQALFQRFKAEESAQAITAKPRLLSPENNNERQQIHDHESVPLEVPARTRKPALAAAGGGQ
jgi:tetratricopeptide (TPR) repeat protein